MTMCRLMTVLVMVAAALVALVVVTPSLASAASSGGCNVRDPSCTVGAEGGAGHGGGGGGGGGGGSAGDPCAPYPDSGYGSKPPAVSPACADELQGRFCQAEVADAADGLEKPPAQWTAEETAAINAGLEQVGCPAVVTPAELAQQAYRTIRFPSPSGDRSPSQDQLFRGYPFTYTGLWTWFWTNSDTWTTLTASASAAGFTATVTARPVALIYDPGDGGAAVTCAGPGRPWTSADGNAAPTGGACAYQYHQVTSAPITSTQSILWKITWTGTGGSTGEIPQLATSTSGQLNVMQIQEVVAR